MANVQAQKIKHQAGTINEVVVVRTMVELPEALYAKYTEQAAAAGKSVEDWMALRLQKTVAQTEDGLWFTNSQKKRLDKCVGHNIGDAEGALQRLENLSKIHVEDVTIELDPRIKSRLASRATMRRKPISELIKHEVVMGLKRFVGLEPA